MITITDLALSFSGTNLFSRVDLKFTEGNCYGVIGANGSGKSTFLKILSGEIEQTKGEIIIPPKLRMSVLKQDHYSYDEYNVLDAIYQGNPRLYEIMQLKETLYAKEDFTEDDGNTAAELEGEFAEMNGWEAETEISRILQGFGLNPDIMYNEMTSLDGSEKVKVLLAQALFGEPDILIMDEPTNHLDIRSIKWFENFLMDFKGTVIVVSHDRHFLNNVCTHIVDIDYTKIKMYVGNYDFWYESSQLMQRLIADQNKKTDEKIKELQAFVQRFSANKSKSNQATSRKKLIDKLSYDEMPASSRRYPFVQFMSERDLGKDVLTVTNLSKTIDGEKLLENVSFILGREDKVAFVSDNELALTTLYKILNEEIEPDEGSFKWGVSTERSYFPKDNSAFFNDRSENIVEWLSCYSKDQSQNYLRGFAGKMLFSGDDVLKPVKVLSGGEKVRLMFSRMMMFGSNTLVIDQPTNHLDLEAITAVNNGLIAYKGVVLFSSHDHQFIETVANRIIDITVGRPMIDRHGTYDEYLEYKDAKGIK